MQDEINPSKVKSCPTCGAPCVLSTGNIRFYMPISISEINKLAKLGSKNVKEKIDRAILNIASALTTK